MFETWLRSKFSGNSTEALKTKLDRTTNELVDAINREDLKKAAETGKEIARTMTIAEQKGLAHPDNVTEIHRAADRLEQAAATGKICRFFRHFQTKKLQLIL